MSLLSEAAAVRPPQERTETVTHLEEEIVLAGISSSCQKQTASPTRASQGPLKSDTTARPQTNASVHPSTVHGGMTTARPPTPAHMHSLGHMCMAPMMSLPTCRHACGHTLGRRDRDPQQRRRVVVAGLGTMATGGQIVMMGGYGLSTSSGSVTVKSVNAGHSGVSGELTFSSGTANSGNTGYVAIGTGASTSGKSGAIDVRVGSGMTDTGGNMMMRAGQTLTDAKSGGRVTVAAGTGGRASASFETDAKYSTAASLLQANTSDPRPCACHSKSPDHVPPYQRTLSCAASV